LGKAVVTGAGRGYGRVVAGKLAEAGVVVGVLGRARADVEAVASETGGWPLVADVLDPSAVQLAIDSFVAEHGQLDLLVNNAGLGGPLGLAWEVPAEEWWRTVEVNLGGTHNVTRAAIPHLLRAGGGTIINVVSHAGTARWPLGSAYAVSKAALIKYGENLAAELRRHGVAVVNYHPGIMDLGLTGDLLASAPEPGSADATVAAWFRREIDSGNAIEPGDSAARLVTLALGPARRLSGRYLTAYDDLDSVLEGADRSAAAFTLGLIAP
jgi:NAD(P)-dependent dehydrogenase (short-subunit alcohol dehydrogenase family)